MSLNPITALTIVAGASNSSGPTGNHIIVYGQEGSVTGPALNPASVTWAIDSSLTSAGVVITPDSTGFFFSAPASTTSAASGVATATYTVNGVTGTLNISVGVVVTALVFSQE